MPTSAAGPARVRVVVSGATGRLGSAFVKTAYLRGWSIVGAIASPREGPRRGLVPPEGVVPAEAVPIEGPSELARRLLDADVYVATAPAPAERTNLPLVAERGIPAVVATTGFGPADDGWLGRALERIPLVMEANFSVGITWLKTVLEGPPGLPSGFEASVVEAHRRGKRDRPSGTAEELAEPLGRARANAAGAPRSTEIASLRLGELPGIHQLWIAGPDELLRIEHIALDRRAFAEGMARAVEWLQAHRGSVKPGRVRFAEIVREASR